MRARFLCPNENFNCVLCCAVLSHFIHPSVAFFIFVFIFSLIAMSCTFSWSIVSHLSINVVVWMLFPSTAIASDAVATDVALSHLICCQLKNMKIIVISSDPQLHTATIPNTHEQISVFFVFVFLATSEYTISTLARTVCVWVCDPLG